ncbi:MAG: hypothetical protein J3R72DRAFT_419769 [Linnemannia gamsii]|nr:MAG: hypothetical protein J3R72DRAFT_419769 [Linnemannia gamsii]
MNGGLMPLLHSHLTIAPSDMETLGLLRDMLMAFAKQVFKDDEGSERALIDALLIEIYADNIFVSTRTIGLRLRCNVGRGNETRGHFLLFFDLILLYANVPSYLFVGYLMFFGGADFWS